MTRVTVPVVAEVYDRLVSSCTTINQVNRVHIACENYLTPTEVRLLARHLRPTAGLGVGIGLVATVRRLLEKYGRQAVARFRGRIKALLLRILRRRSVVGGPSPKNRLSSSLDPRQRRLYSAWWALKLEKELAASSSPSGNGKSRGRKNSGELVRVWRRGEASLFTSDEAFPTRPRALIICIMGNSRRMMMPQPTWLSNVPFRKHDVLILGCPPHKIYVEGVRGFSHTLPETFDAIHKFVADNGYTDVWVMGSSGGALPALFAGLHIGAKGILLASPVDPDVENWRVFLPEGHLARRLEDALQAAPEHPTKIVIAFGVEDNRDVLLAQELVGQLPNASLMPVLNAGHNCLYPLAQRSELAAILLDLVS